jgi:hypothetical protein
MTFVRVGLRVALIFAAWCVPATLAVDVVGCNDGSTGCCMICPECACGDSCISCAMKCTQPKGCACGSMPAARETPVENVSVAPLSAAPDAGDRG